MKEVKAQAKFVRGSYRKIRIIADMVRGKDAMYALDALKYLRVGNAYKVRKVVQSAVANAVNNENLKPENLVITQIFVDEAPTYKRGRPVSKGRYHRILKRNSHITVFVGDKDAKDEPKKKTTAKASTAKATKKTEAKVEEKAAPKVETKTKVETKKQTAKSTASSKPVQKKTTKAKR